MKNLFLTLSILLPYICFSQQKFNSQRVDSLLQLLDENEQFMGSVAVLEDTSILYQKAIGYAQIKKKVPATTRTKYVIGSISKSLTAALILKAVDENLLDLKTSLDSFFPSVTNASSITIEQLLHHRSGIFSMTSDPNYLNWNTSPSDSTDHLSRISKYESVFKPNTTAQYSNSNYVLLTLILENVYKRPFQQILMEKITKPIGLADTYLGKGIDSEKNDAYSYTKSNKWEQAEETHPSNALGAGAIVSTPKDVGLFYNALFAGKIISEELLNQMITLKDNFGMGIFRYPYFGHWCWGHTGGIDGFSSMAVYFRKEKLAAVITSNASVYDNNDLILGMLSAYFGRSYSMPRFSSVKLSDKELEKYIGLYSSTAFPLKVTITRVEDRLQGQATGQPAFDLTMSGENTFVFRQAGLELVFNLEQNQMILNQGGGSFTFIKE